MYIIGTKTTKDERFECDRGCLALKTRRASCMHNAGMHARALSLSQLTGFICFLQRRNIDCTAYTVLHTFLLICVGKGGILGKKIGNMNFTLIILY